MLLVWWWCGGGGGVVVWCGVIVSRCVCMCLSFHSIASFDTSYTVSWRQWVDIAGTAGRLTYDDLTIARCHEETQFTEFIGNGPVPPEFQRVRAVWCGVVWCGVVWCGVVWCGVVWCGVVWCGVV